MNLPADRDRFGHRLWRRRLPDDLTPEEREARIAELREKRRKRMRALAIRSTIGTSVLLVLAGVLLYWLLQTIAGRDALLAQVVARLPAGSSFTWQRIEGPLAGPLTLHGVDFRYGQIHFTAQRVYLDPDLRPLLGKRLRLDALEVGNATLDVPRSDEPFELPKWPDVLPKIEMPLAIQADALKIDGMKVSQAGEPLVDVRRARGGIDIGNGYLDARKLVVDSDRGRFAVDGSYTPRQRYRANLTASAVFPAANARTPARLGLAMRGDRRKMDIAVAGHAPAPVSITATVRGEKNPEWHFRGHTESLDPALLGVIEQPMPLAFDLRADGSNGAATLQGRIEQDKFVAVIEPSRVRIGDDKVLTVEPLALRLLDGYASLRGTADFSDAGNPKFRFSVNARRLGWGDDPKTRIVGSGDFGFAGQLKDWAAVGAATLSRDGQQAKLEFDGRGDAGQVVLEKLLATMPTGKLDATGSVGWAPQLRWDVNAKLAGFDPGYFVAGWNGNVSGNFGSKGAARDPAAGKGEGFDATLDVPRLAGTLRGRALDGRGQFALHGDGGEGELALRLGGSRVDAKGKVGATLDIDAKLQPLHLDDLLPDASGHLAGTLKLTGKRDAPDIAADLSGGGLKWGDYAAQDLELHGRLPWQGAGGQLAVQARGVQAGLLLDSLRLDARGAVENLHLDGDARNALGAIALSGTALRRNGNWRGALEALRVAPVKGEPWSLQQAARYAQNGDAWTLSQSCLAGGGGALCVQADWPRNGASAHADSLPLTLVQPWLPPSKGRPLQLRGAMKLDANFKPVGKAWRGELHMASLEGGIKLGANSRGELIRYDNFSLDVEATPQAINGRLGSGFKGNGYIDARVATGWDDYAPLKGDIYFHNSRLFWMELFSPDLVRPDGVLAGHIGLAGTRGKPALSGEAKLSEFTGELPALGITLVEGEATLTALADGSAKIRGTLKSQSATGGAATGGVLGIDGALGWREDNTTPLQFSVRGNNFLASDTADLRAVASPDLRVGFADNTIQVRGEVAVPAADIDIDRLDAGVSASEDVVVLDPADPDRAPSSRLDLDLAITLGDAVKLKGYGLEGTLTGGLRARSRPGREMLATGRLDVDGRYRAYGQKLDITRGELTWSNSPISDPNIRIRAEREVVSADVTAGIDVIGRASRPEAKVWSIPASSEQNALAYLVLGRPLSTASGTEAQQINAASSALTAGAGLLASQLGAKIGLDDAGVLESRTLGGAVFGVGKYLSPKLYVSYGVSMVGSGSALTLKYLMRKGFDVEIESSTIETRGSLNWRKEK